MRGAEPSDSPWNCLNLLRVQQMREAFAKSTKENQVAPQHQERWQEGSPQLFSRGVKFEKHHVWRLKKTLVGSDWSPTDCWVSLVKENIYLIYHEFLGSLISLGTTCRQDYWGGWEEPTTTTPVWQGQIKELREVQRHGPATWNWNGPTYGQHMYEHGSQVIHGDSSSRPYITNVNPGLINPKGLLNCGDTMVPWFIIRG